MSNYILPILVLIIILSGMHKKINIYEEFIKGAKESYTYILNMFPSVLAMILSVNMITKSNFINNIIYLLKPIINIFNIPLEIIPLAIMRPISASSSLALLNELLTTYGVDSFIGKLGSIIQSSTDTTFYIIMLYYGSVGIKKIRHSLTVGLLTDFISVIISIIIANILFHVNF